MRTLQATITKRGQVTIPAAVRRLLRVGPKDKVAFQALTEPVDAGQEQATTTEAVLAEVVFVLRSRKHHEVPAHDESAHDMRDLPAPIVVMPGLVRAHR